MKKNENKNLVTGTTENGFNYSININVLDDYELVEMCAKLDGGATQLLPVVVETILGAEQKKALMEHLRKDGRVSATEMTKTFFEIMGAIKDGKKF